MANSDVIVSSEQGTILDYFGVANTYDPFTNQSKLQEVKDLNFNIPELPPFDLAEFVAVSTGLLATSLSFLNYCEFSILDKNTGKKITDLKNNIGEIGNSSFYPAENQIFWFNRDGLRGTFYLNKAHAGRVLHITSGMFSTTSITSGVLNDMFARTTGVPKYIQDINKAISDIKKSISLEYKTWSWSLNESGRRSGWYGNASSFIPDKFIGSVIVAGNATAYATATATAHAYAKIGIAFGSPSGRIELAYATATDTNNGNAYAYATAHANAVAVAACMNMHCYISAYATAHATAYATATAKITATAKGYILHVL